MAVNCQIPTPSKYVNKLLDAANYTENLYGKKILENSCGEGNILCEIVKRYINDSLAKGYELLQVKNGLQRDIVAYEIDFSKISICKKRLDDICISYGIHNVNWIIKQKDYLTCDPDTYDFIVGNPPYITYHDMTDTQRKNLRKEFISCKKGRFDYCYAFIEKSLHSLSNEGILAYLIPYGVLRNQYAEEIRSQILPCLTNLYDYEGISVFKDIISSSAIIVCQNKLNNMNFKYHRIIDDMELVISKDILGDKWFFDKKTQGKKRFGDYFDVRNSIATLYNKAFLINDYNCDDEYVYVGDKKIEKSLVQFAVSPKNKRSSKVNKIIIFPYEIRDSMVCHFPSEKYFKEKYPFAYEYLELFKDSLTKRKSSENVKWYEYGRTQALNQVFCDKLVMSQVVTQKVNIYLCKTMDIPYAGYFIKTKDDTHTLEEAKAILESRKFLDYVKSHGTPTTSVSYRISVKEILDYMY